MVELGGKRVDPDDVRFSLRDNGKMTGIFLFLPEFREDVIDLKQIGFLLLDRALGEYDVVTRLGLIEMFSPETQTDGKRYSYSDLPALFDQLVWQLDSSNTVEMDFLKSVNAA